MTNKLIPLPDNELGSPTHEELTPALTIERGQQAWQRLQQHKSFDDWILVGHAHVIGRDAAMRAAKTYSPRGKSYSYAFGQWLEQNGFDNIDGHDRADLFSMMDHLPSIMAWRDILTSTERLRLNHPSTVLRKWKAARQPPADDAKKRPSPWEKQKQALAEVEEKNHKLTQEVLRLTRQPDALGDEWDDKPDHGYYLIEDAAGNAIDPPEPLKPDDYIARDEKGTVIAFGMINEDETVTIYDLDGEVLIPVFERG
jgi:hypothetical protein